MAYEGFKELNRRTAAKVLNDKVFNIAKNPNYDGYHHGLASIVYIFYKTTSGGAFKKEIMQNE